MVLSIFYSLLKLSIYITIFFLVVFILIKLWVRLSLRMCTCKVNLNDKTVVITGGNTGIGFETAKILASQGARVVIASRNVAKSRAAVQAIIDATGNPKIEYKPLDLSKLSSVKQFAEDFNESYERLDILINNAAYAELKQEKSEDGINKMIQVNHVAPVYLTNLLLSKIASSKPSRIIFVASRAHKFHWFDAEDLEGNRPLNTWTRYCNTKLCNVLTAKAFAKRVPEGVYVNSLHPGMGKTEIYEVVPGPLKKILYFLLDFTCKTSYECAQSSVHVASSPHLEEVTGQYFDDSVIAKPLWSVTDELAERVWEKTIALIEDRTQRFKN